MMADKNLVVVELNKTRPKYYHTVCVEGSLSWASFISLGAAVMLLHNILGGGVDAACYYGTGAQSTYYDCRSQSLVVIPTLPFNKATLWYLDGNSIIQDSSRRTQTLAKQVIYEIADKRFARDSPLCC